MKQLLSFVVWCILIGCASSVENREDTVSAKQIDRMDTDSSEKSGENISSYVEYQRHVMSLLTEKQKQILDEYPNLRIVAPSPIYYNVHFILKPVCSTKFSGKPTIVYDGCGYSEFEKYEGTNLIIKRDLKEELRLKDGRWLTYNINIHFVGNELKEYITQNRVKLFEFVDQEIKKSFLILDGYSPTVLQDVSIWLRDFILEEFEKETGLTGIVHYSFVEPDPELTTVPQ